MVGNLADLIADLSERTGGSGKATGQAGAIDGALALEFGLHLEQAATHVRHQPLRAMSSRPPAPWPKAVLMPFIRAALARISPEVSTRPVSNEACERMPSSSATAWPEPISTPEPAKATRSWPILIN